MKDNAHEIIGKKITGVVIKYSKKFSARPQSQLFLLFDDDRSYEFYCSADDIRPTGGILSNTGFDHVLKYRKEALFTAFQASIDPDSGLVVYESHDRSSENTSL